MVRPIVSPTVPVGTERVRVCLHAGNTIDEIDRLVLRMRDWLEIYRTRRAEEEDVGKMGIEVRARL